jgi:hypothetical protein
MDLSNVLKIVATVLWPAVAVVALLLFRLPVMRLANEIAARTRKVSFKGVSVDLEALPALSPTWDVSSGFATQDVRRLTSSELFDSSSTALFEQLLHPRQSDYAVVDLGRGQQWLTSRLFIFSLILGEVSHLKALVFLETTIAVRRRFLGIAAPGSVHAALAQQYPWLEQAFALAYAARYPPLNPDATGQSTLTSMPYILDASQSAAISQLVRSYVTNIQRQTDPPPSELDSYLSFLTPSQPPPGMKTLWERGQWIDAEKLERDLSGCLEYSWYSDVPDVSQKARIEGILRRRNRFVALVDEDRRFTGLVDRHALVLRTLGKRDEGSDSASVAT